MKRLTLLALCFTLVLGLAMPVAGVETKPEVLSITAEEVDGKIYVTATVKNVVFNAMQFRIGYDKRRLTPCDMNTGEATNDANAMVRFDQEEYDPFSTPDGWASYITLLDTEAGAAEYVVSVTPGIFETGPVNEEGYASANQEGLPLLTMCFLQTEGETLYADSIALTGNNFLPTGLVIATDELDEHGVVVGITDGSRISIDLSKVAQPGKTPEGSDIPEAPTTEPPVTYPSGGENETSDPKTKLSDTISDIKGHWAEKEICKLIDYGILAGYVDKTFQPDRPLTRAEFAIVMTKSLALDTLSGPSVFLDCEGFAVPYINAVKEAGLMQGVDNKGNFQPNRNITREEVVVVIAKAFGISGGAELTVPDRSEISAWALDGVTAAVSAGIVQGRPEGFAPKAITTRAEIAKIIAGIV